MRVIALAVVALALAAPGLAQTADHGAHGAHATHDAHVASPSPAGTDLPPGGGTAPAPQPGLAAARYFGDPEMAAADRKLRREHGGMIVHQLLVDLAEYQVRDGHDAYRWDAEAWIGGDIDRLVLKTEGEGDVDGTLDDAEVQALYSRALDPYWDLQAGFRVDVEPGPTRGYATIGIEGLAPYWIEMEGALFLSGKGDLLARVEARHDQRITNALVLQPRLEINLAAQDVPEAERGSGVTDIELGLRLRYERVREFAPYVGITWDRQFGDTARFSRARGDRVGGFGIVAGVRTWF